MNPMTFVMLAALLSSILLATPADLVAQSPKDIVVGEVDGTQTDDTVTLNVHPCGKKELHTISPYREVSKENATCPDGRKYVKLTVEQAGDGIRNTGKGASDKKGEKKPDKAKGNEEKDASNPPN